MRLLVALMIALCLPLLINAQERKEETRDVKLTIDSTYTVQKAAYTRELWVGVSALKANQFQVPDPLLDALSKACDDTTSVAVIMPGVVAGNVEGNALAASVGRDTLRQLATDLGILDAKNPAARKHTRIVLVGLMETCVTALSIANHEQGLADGVVLIDPPVEDLPQINVAARAAGVDVLLHPRSGAEFERETATLVERLGSWGKSARILSGGSFNSLKERVADAWTQLRAPWAVRDTHGFQTPTELAKQIVGDNRVVFVGELHGNPGAHRSQLEFLRHMADSKTPLCLTTEQFERDVQAHLDGYISGKNDEQEFLKNSRPWPNYGDYRPLIEFCREHKIPVIAANIPRPLASRVFKEGVEVIEKFTDDEKAWSANKLNANPGAYRDKFMKTMGGADGHNDSLERMYAAQCIKDDTMAESIAAWLKANPQGRVLHINGNFHSAGGLGVPEKLAALMPDVKMTIVTCVEHGEEFTPAEGEHVIRVPSSRPRRE